MAPCPGRASSSLLPQAGALPHPRENVQLLGSEFKVLAACGGIFPFSLAGFLVTLWVSSWLPFPVLSVDTGHISCQSPNTRCTQHVSTPGRLRLSQFGEGCRDAFVAAYEQHIREGDAFVQHMNLVDLLTRCLHTM